MENVKKAEIYRGNGKLKKDAQTTETLEMQRGA
jgi:hypothetical protein